MEHCIYFTARLIWDVMPAWWRRRTGFKDLKEETFKWWVCHHPRWVWDTQGFPVKDDQWVVSTKCEARPWESLMLQIRVSCVSTQCITWNLAHGWTIRKPFPEKVQGQNIRAAFIYRNAIERISRSGKMEPLGRVNYHHASWDSASSLGDHLLRWNWRIEGEENF